MLSMSAHQGAETPNNYRGGPRMPNKRAWSMPITSTVCFAQLAASSGEMRRKQGVSVRDHAPAAQNPAEDKTSRRPPLDRECEDSQSAARSGKGSQGDLRIKEEEKKILNSIIITVEHMSAPSSPRNACMHRSSRVRLNN